MPPSDHLAKPASSRPSGAAALLYNDSIRALLAIILICGTFIGVAVFFKWDAKRRAATLQELNNERAAAEQRAAKAAAPADPVAPASFEQVRGKPAARPSTDLPGGLLAPPAHHGD